MHKYKYKWFWSLLLCLVFFAPPAHAERLNLQITITAGTPIRVEARSTKVDRLFVQLRHSASAGTVYLMDGVPTTTVCNASDTTQLTAELGPGDATHPGSSYSDPQGANGNTVSDVTDLANFCVDGTHSGDVVIFSFYRRN